MRRARDLLLVFALLAGGLEAAEAGECGIAFGYAGEGSRIGAVPGPSGQMSVWMEIGGSREPGWTPMGIHCDPTMASQAAKRQACDAAVRHVHWHPNRHWHRHHGRHPHAGWQRRHGRHGHRQNPHWHPKPPRATYGGGILGWYMYWGWGWHLHPHSARRHHWHGRQDRRYRRHHLRKDKGDRGGMPTNSGEKG